MKIIWSNKAVANNLLQSNKQSVQNEKKKIQEPEGLSKFQRKKTRMSKAEFSVQELMQEPVKHQVTKNIEVIKDPLISEQEAESLTNKYYHLADIDVSFDAFEIEEFKSLLNKSNKTNKKTTNDYYKDVMCQKSCFIFSKKNKLRIGCAYLGSHSYFETVVLTVIILSSLKLVIETYQTDYWSSSTVNI